jgi:sulfofructose kinase
VAAVTLGKRGWVGFDGRTLIRGEAFSVPVVDTTGAGDVFHGAFCVAWLETADLERSLVFASAVSALKCGKLGGRAGIPTRCELDEFLRTAPRPACVRG